MWISCRRKSASALALAPMRWFLVLLLVALTGCANQATAEQLLERYLEASDNGELEEFDDLLLGSALQSALRANEVMTQLQLHQVGSTRFHSFEDTSETEYVFCLDVSQTRLIDEFGNDLTPPERPEQIPMKMRIEEFGQSLRISELDIRRYSNC